MNMRKLFWAARGIIYKVSFGRFGNISYIGKPVSLVGRCHIFIHDRVRIYPGVRLEAAYGGKIIIKRNTSIAQNVQITADREELIIGENTTILAHTFITNLDHDYRDITKHILDQDRIVRTTKIGDNCFIGFGACIQAGTILGRNCVVGANAVVRGHYPDYSVLVGVPAKVIRKYNPETKEWDRV